MWVIEVDPEEKRGAALLPHPFKGRIYDFVSGTLNASHGNKTLALHVKVIDVGIESLIQPPTCIENISGDEPRGFVAAGLVDFGEGRDLVGHDEPTVVTNAVMRRIGAGEERSVGREGQGRDRIRTLK